jgi:UDP-glucuronate 4-epimerase
MPDGREMRTILVTGAAGFIGHRLCERLLSDGHAVIGVDCFLADSYDPAVKHAAVAALRRHDAFQFHRRDLRHDRLEDLLEAAAGIVHLAAMPGLRSDHGAQHLYTGCNVTATERLTAAARRTTVAAIVHASTSSVYGLIADGDETQPTQPISAYGRSKLQAERIAADAGAVVLRYYSVYGPGQRPDMAYHRFCEAILDNRPVTIHGDGSQQRANTYVDDIVDATVAALANGRPGEAYNVGGATPIMLLDAVATLADALDRVPTLEHTAARLGDQRATRADTSKAQRELGWRPVTTPAVGLDAQAVWHLDRHAQFVAA